MRFRIGNQNFLGISIFCSLSQIYIGIVVLTINDIFFVSVGAMFIDQSIPEMHDLEKQMSVKYGGTVETGGWWRPSDCKARTKVSPVILCLAVLGQY